MDAPISAPIDQGLAEMHRRFDLQHALTRGGVAPTFAERRHRLDRLPRMLAANEAPYSTAISEEFGNRSPDETRMLEIGLVLNAIRYARKNLRRRIRPERRHVDIAFQPEGLGAARVARGHRHDSVARFRGPERAVIILWTFAGCLPTRDRDTLHGGMSRGKSML